MAKNDAKRAGAAAPRGKGKTAKRKTAKRKTALAAPTPAPTRGGAKPSARLAAQAPGRPKAAPGGGATLETVHVLGQAGLPRAARPLPMPIATKFVVAGKLAVPAVGADRALEEHVRVSLVAAYEPESILHGLATRQGCRDNRIFGLGEPDAKIEMTLSGAIAQRFRVGEAFTVVLHDV